LEHRKYAFFKQQKGWFVRGPWSS